MKQDKLNISVREERPEEFRRVEEITKEAFSYSGRIEQGGIGCPYEHWMVHELRNRDGILSLSLVAEIDDTEYYPQFGFVEAAKFGITDCNGANYPAFMAMELQPGYLTNARSGKYYESDIYDDEKNRKSVMEFDMNFDI